jgi:uncharacterized protein YbjT (DUF2867 family)
MKVIITGASGMVGKGVLLECLDHSSVSEVLCIGRSSLNIKNSNLKELIIADFSDFSMVENELKGYDACFFCLGTSAAGMSEKDYRKITYEYTLALAKVLKDLQPDMTFNYVSGEGTDSTEKGRTMWARVKGKTENDLMGLGFKQAFMFRPGAIIPLRGIKSKTKLYQFVYDYFTWLLKVMKRLFPNSICTTTQIGLAMINSVLKGYEKNILTPSDIITLSQK